MAVKRTQKGRHGDAGTPQNPPEVVPKIVFGNACLRADRRLRMGGIHRQGVSGFGFQRGFRGCYFSVMFAKSKFLMLTARRIN